MLVHTSSVPEIEVGLAMNRAEGRLNMGLQPPILRSFVNLQHTVWDMSYSNLRVCLL